MAQIRPYRSEGLPSLHAICVQTGENGEDLTPLYKDPDLLGALYAAPYGVYAPQRCFMLEDEMGAAGYVVGVHDTARFDDWMIRDWLAPYRALHPAPIGDSADWSPDDRCVHGMHAYRRTPEAISSRYPAHLHLNILPRLQRKGWGRRLAQRWIDDAHAAGVSAAHIGVVAANTRGLAFWRAVGFEPIPGLADAEGPDNVFCGRRF